MRFIRDFKEEFYTNAKDSFDKEEYEIYLNPSFSELNKIFSWRTYKSARALVDIGNKNVYVFDSHLLHAEALRELKKLENSIDWYDIERLNIYQKGKQIITKHGNDISNIPWIKKYFFDYKITEEVLTYVQDNLYQTWPIYENPSKIELGKIDSWRQSKELRAVIDPTQKKNIFVADINCLHDHIIEELNLPYTKCARIEIDGGFKTILYSNVIKWVITENPWIQRNFPDYTIKVR